MPHVLGSADLVQRLRLTLLLICLARVGHFIRLPGAAWPAASSSAVASLMGSTDVAANVFSLGIMPLMSAYFVLAVANVVPAVRKHFAALRDEGQQGRDVYGSYTSVLFVAIALSEAFSLARSWTTQAGGTPGVGGHFVPRSMVLLVAGAAICKLITQWVEDKGLGDGTSLLIALGVGVNYVTFLRGAATHLVSAPPQPAACALVVLLCLMLVAAALWIQSVELWLPITFYRGRRTAAPDEAMGDEPSMQHFPLRLSPAGARSLLFASFWTGLLQAPLSWLRLGNPFDSALGFAALVLLVEGVSFADMTPRQIAQFLDGSDAGIVGKSPGDDTQAYLAERRQQLKLLNALLLAALSLAARGVDAASVALVGVPAGSLSLLLLCSTVAAGARQVVALVHAPRPPSRGGGAAGSALPFAPPEKGW